MKCVSETQILVIRIPSRENLLVCFNASISEEDINANHP